MPLPHRIPPETLRHRIGGWLTVVAALGGFGGLVVWVAHDAPSGLGSIVHMLGVATFLLPVAFLLGYAAIRVLRLDAGPRWIAVVAPWPVIALFVTVLCLLLVASSGGHRHPLAFVVAWVSSLPMLAAMAVVGSLGGLAARRD
jgi:hypothetical protein